MCINSSTAAQIWFLSLNAAATRVHAVQPWHANFFQQKQEAQSNLCLTQWLSLASRGTTLCFAHFSLYFSHQQKQTEAQYCHTTHIKDAICLHSQLLYLFTPKKISYPNSTDYTGTDLFTSLCYLYSLLYHANSGDSQTCWESESSWISCYTAVLQVMENLSAFWGQVGRSGESLVGSWHLYKVEPAGWEQEGSSLSPRSPAKAHSLRVFIPHLLSGW